MLENDQDVQEGWQILVSLVDKVIPGLIPEHGYPEMKDTSGGEPTNTSTGIKIPDPVPESLLFQEEEVSLEKLLLHCVADVVNTFTITQLSLLLALTVIYFIHVLQVPVKPPPQLVLFVDRMSWETGTSGVAVKRKVNMRLEPYLSMPRWAPCTREYERFTKGRMFLTNF